MRTLRHYISVWLRLTASSFQTAVVSPLGAFFFVFAKLIRFGFYLLMLMFIMSHARVLAGYTTDQVLFIFLTFTLVDTLAQLLFREVYRFKGRLVSGDFDMDLLKPIPSVFRPLLGGADALDLITSIPYLVVVVIFLLHFHVSALSTFLYFLLILNSIIIAAAFHILVLSLGILTMEVDNLMQVYRDLTSLGRFPLAIYSDLVRGFLTFIIPVGIMVSLPSNLVLSIVSPTWVGVACIIGGILMVGSIRVWKFSLRLYTSASS